MSLTEGGLYGPGKVRTTEIWVTTELDLIGTKRGVNRLSG